MIPGMVALNECVERGVDLLLIHEPTFYIAIMRLHDRWDIWPEYGIPWSWARFLELAGPPVAIHQTIYPGTLHRYDVEPRSLGEFARHVASKTSTLGEPHPVVVGDLDQQVSKVGVGTGCGCQVEGFRELGCDVSLICDDGSSYWQQIQRWEDEGHPVIRVNHGTCEEPGMDGLERYINERINGVEAEYLPMACKFHQIQEDAWLEL